MTIDPPTAVCNCMVGFDNVLLHNVRFITVIQSEKVKNDINCRSLLGGYFQVYKSKIYTIFIVVYYINIDILDKERNITHLKLHRIKFIRFSRKKTFIIFQFSCYYEYQ